ncbi:Modification methylase HaeIII [Mycobacterium marinum]|uniref:DNA (cytosine-5-)-methyltransferase n=1 Tax=Mycobacterium marinum TaxID=1781 RepID=A0A3E2MW54_MYCMR|nr:DNA cytosine methyltransferase [Mycobacterium marinum]RFZ41372.1 Modification methylase HaeIII [Mycobacterium marinum]
MTLTLTDLFCGAGGSSTGAIAVPGVTVRIASNHWDLAVETHNANHPDADHLCADLSAVDPRRFPHTDLLWASPECTNHSVAKGRKRADTQPDLFGEILPDAAAERSRATMWDVPRFAEAHRYQAVIVENVVDAWNWQPFRAWLMAMDSLGYDHHIVFLNSMHAQTYGPGAPQSRDRMYVLFWRKGNQRPDIDRVTAPVAVCPQHGEVRARQAFKRVDRAPWGRYHQQYVYTCPVRGCITVIEPNYRPAAEIIDWTLLGQRIGDRAKPLAEKTLARIRAGIQRYWAPLLVEAAGNTYDAANPRHPAHGRADGYYRAWPLEDPMRTVHTTISKALAVPVESRLRKTAQSVDEPLRTQTTRNETGLAFIAELRGGGSKHRPVTDPLCTVVANGNHHGLVTTYYGNGATRPATDPLATVTAVERHALLMRNNRGAAEMTTPITEPARTITTTGHQSLLAAEHPTINIDDVLFRMLEPREIAAAMDFPREYVILGNRREQVRQAGNAVTPPAARDLVGVVAESLGVTS